MKKTLTLVLICAGLAAQAQITKYSEAANKQAKTHLKTLLEYLELPCDAAFKEDILKNYDWVLNEFTKRGFSSQKIETATLPILLLEKKASRKDARTIMFYYHSDGQPVKKEEWNQEDPYKPVLKKLNKATNNWDAIPMSSLDNEIDPEWRIFARGSSDDKGPGVMMLAALDAMNDLKLQLDFNLKIIVDFEEEKGSPSLPSIIEKNKKDLLSDLLLIFDGPAHASNLPTITYGARGIGTLTLTTYGPYSPLHSGHYGNYIPNPALAMAKLLADMKDDEGRVTIPGFYDGVVLDKKTKDKLAKVPDDLDALNKRMGILKPDMVGSNYQESLIYPSLNIRGLKSAEVGALAATIIPDKAIAEIDIRVVTSTKPEHLMQSVRNYILSKGYFITENEPILEERMKYEKICRVNTRPAYEAFSTDMNSELGEWIEKAIQKTTTKDIIKLPTMGGSVPISPFVSKLKANAIIVPTVNSDNNQHSANENLRLGNYFDGVNTILSILISKF